MSVKASVSLTESQDAYAREMVAQGRYPSLSAVLQHGLELLRMEAALKDAELDALRGLLSDRQDGPFVTLEEGRERTRRMIAAKTADDGL